MTSNTQSTTLSMRAYVIGFALSLVLTLTAYVIATQHLFSPGLVLGSIVTLACVQFVVQLVCFLHLGREEVSQSETSREKLAVFGFAILIVFILVSGSLWIMSNLNQRMMPSTEQMTQYMQSQAGI